MTGSSGLALRLRLASSHPVMAVQPNIADEKINCLGTLDRERALSGRGFEHRPTDGLQSTVKRLEKQLFVFDDQDRERRYRIVPIEFKTGSGRELVITLPRTDLFRSRLSIEGHLKYRVITACTHGRSVEGTSRKQS